MATKKAASTVKDEDVVAVEDTDSESETLSKDELKAALEEKRNANEAQLEQARSEAEEIVEAEQSVDDFGGRVEDYLRKREQAEKDYIAQLPKQKAEQELENALKAAPVALEFDFSTNDAGQVVEPQVLDLQDRKKAEGQIRSEKAKAQDRIVEGVPETGV